MQFLLRNATLAALNVVKETERNELLGGVVKESEVRERKRDASLVTESLMGIREMMAAQLKQAEDTTEVLGNYSQQIIFLQLYLSLSLSHRSYFFEGSY